MKTKNLVIKDGKDLIFGKTPKPVKTGRGLVIGGGTVYPEVNFTVPEGTVISRETLPELSVKYSDAVKGVLQRALELHSPGVIIEFETLLEMTTDPFIGVEITKRMNEVCEEYFQKHQLKSEIRLTPNDTRDFDRPPKMRTGNYLDNMLMLFQDGAAAGGDLLSIESTGGKEICDEAITMGDIQGVMFALTVLGVHDMRFLWREIVKIAEKQGKIAGGDTACGFANTAMVLAEKQYIPRTFAALVRIISVVRSLVAIEEGAIGPDKDCGYEGIYLKALTGIPISMEGKTAACAHLSPVGNVASVAADLWSNESVQNIHLLAGMAPTVYFEQLEYDCRLMNTALKEGPETALNLRNLMVESDIHLDPQALVLAPNVVIAVSEEMIKGKNYVQAAKNGALKGLALIKEAFEGGSLILPDKEIIWLDRLNEDLQNIPDDESKFIDLMLERTDRSKFSPEEYELS